MGRGPSLARISAVDRYVRFVNEAARLGHRADGPAEPGPVVTISREAGCDAHAVADALVERLRPHAIEGSSPWTVFDRNLVERVLEEHGLPANLAKYMPEDAVSDVADSFDEFLGLHPSSSVLVRRTAETIRRLAGLGNVVIVGRAANMVTEHLPRTFHVRLVGSPESRIRRLQESESLTRPEAVEHLRRIDAGRRRYVKKYYGADIDDPLRYDAVLNTDRASDSDLAALIADGVLRRQRSTDRQMRRVSG